MNKTRHTITGAAAAIVVAAGSAQAADAIPVTLSVVPITMPVAAEPGFDWAGIYAGVVHAVVFDESRNFSYYAPAVQVGFNLTLGPLLIGGQTKVGAWIESGGGRGGLLQLDARVGVALDRVAIYGLFGGIAYAPLPLSWYAVGGAGIEVALGDRVSVFAEVRLEELFDPPFYIHGTVGLNWHFGN